jgi:glycerophosphoryl diester phosphodiesterase
MGARSGGEGLQVLGSRDQRIPTLRQVLQEVRVDMHDLGLKVSTWTFYKPRDMACVMQAGVDAIVSNRIGALRRQVS